MKFHSFALVACSIFLLSACDSSTEPEVVSVEGTYTLETVNGENLPFALVDVDADNRVEVTGGVIVLNEDGTFSDDTDLRLVEQGEVTLLDEDAVGTYTVSGTTITFLPAGGGSYSAVINASAGTISQTIANGITGEGDIVFLYER